MTVILHEKPAPAGTQFGLIDYGRVISGPHGGEDTRIDRKGSRWWIKVDMPPMRASVGRSYTGRLARGKSLKARIEWPLGDAKPGQPGTPVLAVTDEQGTQITIGGFNPFYVIREGAFFSIETDGKFFMYQQAADADIVCDAAGAAAVPIWPPLRRPTIAGDVCHFAKPMIEGYVQGDVTEWQMAVDHNVGFSFVIKEDE